MDANYWPQTLTTLRGHIYFLSILFKSINKLTLKIQITFLPYILCIKYIYTQMHNHYSPYINYGSHTKLNYYYNF